MKTKSVRPLAAVLDELRTLANPEAVAGLARFGIQGKKILGVSIPTVRNLAKVVGKDHKLAESLWKSGIHEARILAAYIDVPAEVTPEQMERWVNDFDSWDICDQVCGNLFDRTPHAIEKARAWSKREEEFVKRAGFVLMAYLAVHDKKAPDQLFLSFLPRIEHEAADPRNFVRKAVNWALRQIGKRNPALRKEAISTARRILEHGEKSSHWVARDALRELKKA